MPKDGLDLFVRHPGKPFEKVVHPRAILEIGEERLHGNSRSTENPGTTDRCGISLDG